MTSDEEWQLLTDFANKQNAAIAAAVEQYFAGKERPVPEENPIFKGGLGVYEGINISVCKTP